MANVMFLRKVGDDEITGTESRRVLVVSELHRELLAGIYLSEPKTATSVKITYLHVLTTCTLCPF